MVSESCISILSNARDQKLPSNFKRHEDLIHFYRIQLVIYLPGAILAVVRVIVGFIGVARLNLPLLSIHRACLVISFLLTSVVVVIVNPYFGIHLMTFCIQLTTVSFLIKEIKEQNDIETIC